MPGSERGIRALVIETLVLFGATGDLAGRFLLPALAALQAGGRLPGDFAVVGAASGDWDDQAFRRHAEEQLDEHAADVPAAAREQLVAGLRYCPVDVADADSVGRVLAVTGGTGPVAAYLALPPALFPTTVTTLGSVGLPAGSRIALEKPFGHDVASARELNQLLERVVGSAGEQAVFRVDHALGMATVVNLLGLRMANPLLDAVWNSRYVEQVDVLWEETLALEGRAGYYDGTGALEDVVQNHMLQVLCVAAMEPPAGLDERALRDAKVGALRAIRPLTKEEVGSRTRRARYTAGRLADTGGADGGEVPDYAEEDGVDATRGTETFAEVLLQLDNPRWAGTVFRLRTGKALGARRKGVLVHFRRSGDMPSGPFADELWIGVDEPNDLTLQLVGRGADASAPGWQPVTLTGPPPPSSLPAYARVLLNVLEGDSTLSVRGDGAVEAWRVVTPIVESWASGSPPLLEYEAGSSGPPALGVG
jgi:glucose-6-phosphate 1-dehydrogenase